MGRVHVDIFFGAFFQFEVEHAYAVVFNDDLVVLGIEIQGVLVLSVDEGGCE